MCWYDNHIVWQKHLFYKGHTKLSATNCKELNLWNARHTPWNEKLYWTVNCIYATFQKFRILTVEWLEVLLDQHCVLSSGVRNLVRTKVRAEQEKQEIKVWNQSEVQDLDRISSEDKFFEEKAEVMNRSVTVGGEVGEVSPPDLTDRHKAAQGESPWPAS